MSGFNTHVDLAITTVDTAPVPPTTGTTLTVAAGTGARFGSTFPMKVTIQIAGELPDATNAEIGLLTGRSGDVFTLVRGSNPRTIIATDLIYGCVDAADIQAIEAMFSPVAWPASESATGQPGQYSYQDGWKAECVATDTWIFFPVAAVRP